MYRQGDLLIKIVDLLPKGKIISDGVISRGEVTGHTHKLVDGIVIQTDDGNIYLETRKDSRLTHEEHKDIVLPPGKWAVIKQKEYISQDMVKLVTD